MVALVVVDPDLELPSSHELVTTLLHTEAEMLLNLVAIEGRADLRVDLASHPDAEFLRPGGMKHQKSGKHYILQRVVREFSSGELGVWYTATHGARSARHPSFFRPLHTAEGSGWLDSTPLGPRFTRYSYLDWVANPIFDSNPTTTPR